MGRHRESWRIGLLAVVLLIPRPAWAGQAPPGPAPQTATDGQGRAASVREIADMAFQGAALADVFRILGELAGLNVLVDPSASGTVTFFLRRIPPMEAIDLVARSSGLGYRIVNGTLVVAAPQLLQERFTDERTATVQLEHLDLADAERLVRAVVPEVQVASLARARTLWLRGPSAAVERARELLARQDVALTPELEFTGAPLPEVLKSLARAGGFSLVLPPELQGISVTLYLRAGTPVQEALEAVARQTGLEYRFDSPTLLVVSRVPAVAAAGAQGGGAQPAQAPAEESPAMQLRGYQPRYLSLSTARQLLASAFADIEVTALEESRSLLLRGSASRLEAAVAFVQGYDRPALRAAGVIQVGDQFRALLEVNGTVHVVRVGSRIGELEVAGIDLEGITVVVDGQQVRVAAGGGAR